jgi:hypothetical protein
VTSSAPGILTPAPAPGAVAGFQASGLGRVTIVAMGQPHCPAAQAPCTLPPAQFTLQVVVETPMEVNGPSAQPPPTETPGGG